MQNSTKGKNPYYEKPHSWSSHSLIRQWLLGFTSGAQVLDVGVGVGVIGKYCQEIGLSVTGIEPVSDWAESAKPYYQKMLASNLDRIPDQELAGYDVIVLADVLEHMPDPDGSMERLIRLQDDQCMYFISVPNIANIWVRLNQLIGKFEYTDRGILDRTHLRFFTRNSITNLLVSRGLIIYQIQPTPIPLELVSNYFECSFIGRLAYRCLNTVTRLFPSLFGYQFVIRAKAV